MISQDTIDELHRIIHDTKVAQQDLINALDQIAALPWPQHNEIVGDLVSMIEPTLYKLSVHLTRIALRAQKAMPPMDLDAVTDRVAEEFIAAQDQGE